MRIDEIFRLQFDLIIVDNKQRTDASASVTIDLYFFVIVGARDRNLVID